MNEVQQAGALALGHFIVSTYEFIQCMYNVVFFSTLSRKQARSILKISNIVILKIDSL